jgi:hypothetical protein
MDKKFVSIFLIIAFMIFPLCVSAAKGVPTRDEVQLCLMCHQDKGLTKKLENKERLSLYIDGNQFMTSVHRKVKCTGCHNDISMDTHPRVKTINSRKEYSAQMYRKCRICHTDQQLSKNPLHSQLMARASCAECHGSHYIKGVKAEKVAVQENIYCISCHRNQLFLTMKNGESLSLYIDQSMVGNSVHGKLKCTECHAGFSKTVHPVRSFNSRRDYSILTADACRKCHAEVSKQFEGSVHLSLLKTGNLKAPTCTDCHGAHGIASAKKDRTVGLTSCNKCHADMKPSYESSVHGKAFIKGKAEAPSCSSCHNAHNIESTTMTTKIKDGCLKCHKDAAKAHNKWLKNPPIALPTFAKAHFDVVSCAACHSPDAKRRIYLTLYNQKTEKPLPEEELVKLLDTEPRKLKEGFDPNKDGKVDGQDLLKIFGNLFSKGVSTTFMGTMDVSNSVESHMIAPKAEAVKNCEKCHIPGTEFYNDVFVAVKKSNGKPILIPAEKDTVRSVFSIIPVRKFYAIGGSSIELWDILFIVALIGGIAVPIGHMSLRIIFSPIRSLRRMGKGGKK